MIGSGTRECDVVEVVPGTSPFERKNLNQDIVDGDDKLFKGNVSSMTGEK